MSTTVPMFVMPGGPELMIILFLAVLLFGASKLPKLARSAGESMGEFQKGRETVERELEELRQTPVPTAESAPDVESELE